MLHNNSELKRYSFQSGPNEWEARFFSRTDEEMIHTIRYLRFRTVDQDIWYHRVGLVKTFLKYLFYPELRYRNKGKDLMMIRAWIKRLKVIPKHKR